MLISYSIRPYRDFNEESPSHHGLQYLKRSSILDWGHMRLSINGGTPSHHPFFNLFSRRNHPAIGGTPKNLSISSPSHGLIRLLASHGTGRERQRSQARVLGQRLAIGAASFATRLPETAVVLGDFGENDAGKLEKILKNGKAQQTLGDSEILREILSLVNLHAITQASMS